MPNWCNNTVSISGPAEDVKAFMEKAKGRTHKHVGPFNADFSEREKFDWGTFTPLMMEIIYNNPDTFTRGEEDIFSFHALYPVPKEVLLAPYDDGRLAKAKVEYSQWFDRFPDLLSGYQWENYHWGCKWGGTETYISSDFEEDGEVGYVSYSFDTPWGPPDRFFAKVSSDWPTLAFALEYSESGMGFAGRMIWENGSVSLDEEYESEEDEEDGSEE